MFINSEFVINGVPSTALGVTWGKDYKDGWRARIVTNDGSKNRKTRKTP